ncbi:hypothetical protein GIB67_027635, partial [Kingdonia uniflora]
FSVSYSFFIPLPQLVFNGGKSGGLSCNCFIDIFLNSFSWNGGKSGCIFCNYFIDLCREFIQLL